MDKEEVKTKILEIITKEIYSQDIFKCAINENFWL